MKNLIYICTLALAVTFSSCEDFMDPNLDNHKSPDLILKSRDDFMGELYKAYATLPTRINFTYEAATDNAVANNGNHVSSRAARGGISSISNPLGEMWEANYRAINRINWYIEKMVLDPSQPIPTPVKFDIDPTVNMQFFYFTLGEAYFLRAWYEFDLLQKYGGVADDGKAYGFPLSTKYLTAEDQIDLPRNTYQECVDRIVADCDSAYKYLPLNYSKAQGLLSEGIVDYAGHASGIAAAALKARAYLYAASDAYNVEKDINKWKKAAETAAFAISAEGFKDLMKYPDYFSKDKLNDKKYDNPDMLFRGPIQRESTTYETENFPPRAGSGGGLFNPTQNLIDAFPMSDGYPITAPSVETPYNSQNQFANRDSRLDQFILRTGEDFGGITVNTAIGGQDAFGSDVNATRTGYYLQKWLNGSVRLAAPVTRTTFASVLLGKAELYLNFAEAAVRATGNPDDKTYTYSAREVLAKIRNRALGNGNDKYLPTITRQEDFLQLVMNERRIELCFENHRFWDLRRWAKSTTDVSQLNVPVYGIYSADVLESRLFRSPYMPLPYGELLKTNNLVNNKGWN